MSKKYIKLAIIISAIIVFFISAFELARGVKKHSYDSKQIVYENYVSEVLPSMVEELSSKDDSSSLTPGGNVSSMYDEAGIYDKVKKFLGEDTDKYWDTLMDIETG